MPYPNDGIEPTGDADDGECGIKISRLQVQHYGSWKCVLIRKSLRANQPGSDIAEARIQVIPQTARLSEDEDDDEPKLLGYKRNKKDVIVSMNVTINKNEVTDIYWIIQRKLILYEGDKEKCTDDTCYRAYRKRKIKGGPGNMYNVRLRIDELTREDLEAPVVLVKDYRDSRTRKDFFDIQFVPQKRRYTSLDFEDFIEDDFETRRTRKDDDDDDDDDDDRDRTDFARKRDQSDTCVIDDELYERGDKVTFADLCAKIVCKRDGAVDVEPMDASDCRGRNGRGRGDDREF